MGFKRTSEPLAISFALSEAGPNTFTEEEIALQLDILNNEIFVVLAVDLNCAPPDATATVDTATTASVSSTSQTAITNLGNTNVLAISERAIQAAGFADGGVGFSHFSGETPTADLDYIGIIATNNFFFQVKGTANGGAKSASGRVWGYRARADATTYAALVQSEVLSA